MLILYQFPVSHYCEKVRWALDFKGLEYQVTNLLPGAHIKFVQSIAPKTEVPVLRHDTKIIQGSSEIITYLDRVFPDKSLTPSDPALKQQVLDWETFADENIGPHTRLYCYHFLLDNPDIVVPLLSHGQPWHKRWVFRIIFPKVRVKLRKFMHINDRTAEISLKKLKRAIDKLAAELATKPFLSGDQFTRADLAAASLLAPLCTPEKYGVNWPEKLPKDLQQTIDSFKDKLDWINTLYQIYR
ncbi:MAG: glutathione S-transferase family protein [Gammaproteobacteria bacterium]|jgi:glutathione S-transferase